MTRILVLSDPPAAPGYLPRVRYLCDYLTAKGYQVTWVTEAYGEMNFAHAYPLVTIPMYRGRWDWMIKSVWTLLTNWHDRFFANKILQHFDKAPFDIVLCSAFNTFPLGAAQRIAHTWGVPFVCDIRDLEEQVEGSNYQYQHRAWWTRIVRPIYRAIHTHRRNKALRAADEICTVSKWHEAFIRRFNEHVHVVYNGYDEQQFYPAETKSDRFTICYIGSLFEWQQAGLDTVKRAIDELQLPVQLELHTPTQNPIAHDRLGDAIRQSGIMLVLTNTHTHGMLTTKFYEALGCAKPILCVPSDQGELAAMIAYTHSGIATDDIETIKTFITDHYTKWQQNGFTRQQTLHQETFSRSTQCAQILEWL